MEESAFRKMNLAQPLTVLSNGIARTTMLHRQMKDRAPCAGGLRWTAVLLCAATASMGAAPGGRSTAAGPVTATAATPIVEEIIEVPVQLQGSRGQLVKQRMLVSITRPADDARHPFLVLHHGRPSDARGFAGMGVQNYPANAHYFAGLGFAVLTPTRVGYGSTGGPDLEYTGECRDKHHAAGIAPAVEATRQLLRHAIGLTYVDTRRGLVVGESFGGIVAIASVAQRLPGVQAGVNISGGDGGDPVRRIDTPCRPDQMQQTFAVFGARTALPTLWMYSANDRLWGPRYPSQWYAAFRAAGGNGRFVQLPADKNNGHYIFNRNAAAWHPAFEQFLNEIGFDPRGGAAPRH